MVERKSISNMLMMKLREQSFHNNEAVTADIKVSEHERAGIVSWCKRVLT